MINLRGRAKRRAWRTMMLLMQKLNRVFARDLFKLLNLQYRNAAKLVSKGLIEPDRAVDEAQGKMVRAYEKNYRRAGTVFAGLMSDALEKHDKQISEDFWGEFNEFLKTNVAMKVTQVGVTTKKLLRKIIADGIEKGDTQEVIAKTIRNVSSVKNKFRTLRIARTEAHTAAVMSTNITARVSSVRFEREWVAALDARTRDEHNAANGERVKQDQPYLRTGEALMFPGDPAGSAWNIIHCRCVEIYHTV